MPYNFIACLFLCPRPSSLQNIFWSIFATENFQVSILPTHSGLLALTSFYLALGPAAFGKCGGNFNPL